MQSLEPVAFFHEARFHRTGVGARDILLYIYKKSKLKFLQVIGDMAWQKGDLGSFESSHKLFLPYSYVKKSFFFFFQISWGGVEWSGGVAYGQVRHGLVPLAVGE